MITSSNENIFSLTGHMCGEFTGHLRLDKRLSKQSWGWWFQTPSHPLIRHRNVHNPLHRRVHLLISSEFTVCSIHTYSVEVSGHSSDISSYVKKQKVAHRKQICSHRSFQQQHPALKIHRYLRHMGIDFARKYQRLFSNVEQFKKAGLFPYQRHCAIWDNRSKRILSSNLAKSRFAHNLFCSCPIVLKFYTFTQNTTRLLKALKPTRG